MPVVETADATLFVEVEGEGRPVTVLAHGLTNNRNELAAFTPFVPGTKVRFDFRGHGRSTAPDTGFGFVNFAGDLDAVARAYGATVAVGTSLGAGAIANLLSRHPDRFDRTIWLLPAGLDLPFAFRERYEQMADDLVGKTPEEALQTALGDPARVTEFLQTPRRFEVEQTLWAHDDPEGLARAIRGVVQDFPVPDRALLRRVTNPVLLVCIEGDEVHPVELGHVLVDLLPNAELVVYESQEALLADIPHLVQRVISFVLGNG
jgi:pimeloyl-ACP methyl ester carboxylesterase